MPRYVIDIAGQRFGRVFVVRRAGLESKSATWLCQCDCGKTFVAFGGNLRKGDTKSCGCLRSTVTSVRSLKHGHIAGSTREKRNPTKTYRCWSNMLTRCYNKKQPEYINYGGRGIFVCKRWHKFENFLADMGESPPGLSLERRNNSLGYSKRNCYWATASQQMKNRRPYQEWPAVIKRKAVLQCQ